MALDLHSPVPIAKSDAVLWLLCDEISAARREVGQSQQQLSKSGGVTREAIAHLEGGVGSVTLTEKVMATIPLRLRSAARGLSIVDQIVNARRKWGSTIEKLAS